MDCLFCKIANKEIESDFVYEDDKVVAFNDINPQAPVHVLIVPRIHISTLNDITEEHNELLGHIMQTAKKIAQDLNIDESGYRVLFNCNRGAGQAVFHIHLHLLGGRQMTWPPG